MLTPAFQAAERRHRRVPGLLGHHRAGRPALGLRRPAGPHGHLRRRVHPDRRLDDPGQRQPRPGLPRRALPHRRRVLSAARSRDAARAPRGAPYRCAEEVPWSWTRCTGTSSRRLPTASGCSTSTVARSTPTPRSPGCTACAESEIADLTVFDTLDEVGREPVRRAPRGPAPGRINTDRRRGPVRPPRRDAALGAPRESALRAPDGALTASCTGSATTRDRRSIARGPVAQPAAARRGPADRPDRQLGVGPAERTRSAAPTGCYALYGRDPRVVRRHVRRLPRDGPPRRPGRGRRGRAGGPRRRRRVRVRGPGPGADARLGVDPRPRGVRTATTPARPVVGCRGPTRTSPRPSSPSWRWRTGPPERPDAGGRDAPPTRHARLEDVLGHARSPGAAPRRLGARPRRSCPPRTAAASSRSTSRTRTAPPTPRPRTSAPCRARRSPTGRSASGRSVWDDARLTIAFPVLVRRRGAARSSRSPRRPRSTATT